MNLLFRISLQNHRQHPTNCWRLTCTRRTLHKQNIVFLERGDISKDFTLGIIEVIFVLCSPPQVLDIAFPGYLIILLRVQDHLQEFRFFKSLHDRVLFKFFLKRTEGIHIDSFKAICANIQLWLMHVNRKLGNILVILHGCHCLRHQC